MRPQLLRYMLPVVWLTAARPASPPRCAYLQVAPATRQLLLQIDREVPRALAALRPTLQTSGYSLPYVEAMACFQAFPVERAFHPPAAPRVTQHLRHAYYKQLGDSTVTDEFQWATADVMEYDSPAAATAAKQVLDSLIATCKGRIQELEPCAGYRGYRVSCYGACLLRFSYYSQDPMRRAGLQELWSRVRLLPAGAAATRRP